MTELLGDWQNGIEVSKSKIGYKRPGVRSDLFQTPMLRCLPLFRVRIEGSVRQPVVYEFTVQKTTHNPYLTVFSLPRGREIPSLYVIYVFIKVPDNLRHFSFHPITQPQSP